MGVRVWQSDGDDAGGSFSTCLEWETGMETGEKWEKEENDRNNGEFNGQLVRKKHRNKRKYDDMDHFTYMLLVK